LALFLTSSLLVANSRLGLLISSGVTTFLILRLHSLGNIVNLILLFSLLVTIEVYSRQNS
jgi:hypothetical protein